MTALLIGLTFAGCPETYVCVCVCVCVCVFVCVISVCTRAEGEGESSKCWRGHNFFCCTEPWILVPSTDWRHKPNRCHKKEERHACAPSELAWLPCFHCAMLPLCYPQYTTRCAVSTVLIAFHTHCSTCSSHQCRAVQQCFPINTAITPTYVTTSRW